LCRVGFDFEFGFDTQNYDDMIWFLLLPFSKNQTELYNKYIQNVASDFQNIPIHLLHKISSSLLELVFNNHNFIRPSETFMFKLLIEDPSKYYLLKFINLCQVDISVLKGFLEPLEVNEVNIELFENIKQLLLINLEEKTKSKEKIDFLT
jgi:hypothetical protein